jgi:hypothetical protein
MWVWTHDPGFRASEDSARLRPLGYRNRPESKQPCYYFRPGHSLQFLCLYAVIACDTCLSTCLLLLLLLVGWDWVHLVLRALLTYCTSPIWYMMVIVEQLVEWKLAEETEVLGENLPQRHFAHHKSHMTRSGLEPGSQRLTAWAMARPYYMVSVEARWLFRSRISVLVLNYCDEADV